MYHIFKYQSLGKIMNPKIIKELRIFCTSLQTDRFWGILVTILIIFLITKINHLELAAKEYSSTPVSGHIIQQLPTQTPQSVP